MVSECCILLLGHCNLDFWPEFAKTKIVKMVCPVLSNNFPQMCCMLDPLLYLGGGGVAEGLIVTLEHIMFTLEYKWQT